MNDTQAAAQYLVYQIWGATGLIASLLAAIGVHVLDGWVGYEIGILLLLPVAVSISWALVVDGRVRRLVEWIGQDELDTLRQVEQRMEGET